MKGYTKRPAIGSELTIVRGDGREGRATVIGHVDMTPRINGQVQADEAAFIVKVKEWTTPEQRTPRSLAQRLAELEKKVADKPLT